MTAAAEAFVRERAELAGRLPAAALGLLAAPLLASNGGYYPTSWGWAAMAMAGAAVVGAIARTPSRASPWELVFIGGFALYAVWLALAMTWTETETGTALEVERALVYLAAAVAVKSLVRRRHVPALLGGVLAGMTLICAYALTTRLFPDHFAAQTFGANRLNRPIGYWNGLGLVAAMAALLALAAAARGSSGRVRALAASTLPILLTTLYFTFSRGATLSLAAGLVILFAASTRRVQLLAVSVPVALGGGAAVFLASRSGPLHELRVAKAAAAHSGHREAVVVVVCCLVCACVGYLGLLLEKRLAVPESVTRAAGRAAFALAVVAVAGAVAYLGGPQRIAHRIYHSISSNPPAVNGNLNNRLFSLSSNGRLALWRVALHTFERHPLAGTGPGSYQEEWLAHRTVASQVTDAHSLYLEQLAEDGVVGLALLLVAFAAPFAIFRRARRQPLAAGALAAFSAYLLHSFVDWDWELSGVTLAALLCAGALLAAGRSESRAGRWRSLPIVLGSVVTLAAFAGLAGNLALSASHDDLVAGNNYQAIAEAKRASFWAPWSATPYQYEGEAELALDGRPQALADFHKAVAKDEGDYTLWLDLARASSGAGRAAAVAAAERLNPLDPSIAAFGSAR